jgi:hypothetical protein
MMQRESAARLDALPEKLIGESGAGIGLRDHPFQGF